VGLVARRWARFEPLLLDPRTAVATLGAGDAALGRLDVRETLDGIEDGLWALSSLAAGGVRVLNSPSALVSAHDKLVTARALRRAGLPHPETQPLNAWEPAEVDGFPVVLKPRFGSWGRHVVLCRDRAELDVSLERLSRQRWFTSHGALVQELIPPLGHDLRVLVAGGTAVGAVKRVPAPGEWRTNVAIGATRLPLDPPPIACELAVAAAAAVGADLVGVDLLPLAPGRYIVLEVNGAADFNRDYSVECDVFDAVVAALERRLLGSEGSLPPPAAAAAAV
jgi:[lysine-biosynthesis-protein LysW]--L-2-aminoadipate ligase